MPKQNKQAKTRGYKLIILSAGGVILGSAIPILAVQRHAGTSTLYLVAMEIIATSALIYVFALYLLKK